MAYDFDYGTLNWVKSEIDDTLKQARAALETYVENTEDETQLRFCINYLHQVNGTLQMVELYGASLAAEEMEALALDLVDGKISQRDDAYEALMRGILQLPDYLDRLQSGQRDMPVVLLPLLNDIRAARGQALLSENALFNPDLAVEAPTVPEIADPADADIRQLARRLRPEYHRGLLGWFRDRDRGASLQKIGHVVGALRAAAGEQDTARLLWVAGGVIEALRDGGLESSVAVKRLVGQVDRQIKQIIDGGESRLIEAPPRELMKNLLYYVAQSDSNGELVRNLKQDFRLDALLPDAGALDQARDQLGGPSSELLETVSKVILEDLTQVKDNLDLFVRADQRDVKQLKPLSDTLAQMADTLAMLGLGIQRKTIQDQVNVLDQMNRGEREPEDTALMDVAGALLSIEASLKDLGQRTTRHDGGLSAVSAEGEAAVEQAAEIPEFRQVMGQTIGEVKAELSRIKEAVSDFSAGPAARDGLIPVPGFLKNIRGSLTILNMERAAELVDACQQYVEHELLGRETAPEPADLDKLADAITSIEYYLESIDERWGHPSAILEVAAQSLEALARAGGAEIDAPPAPASESVSASQSLDTGSDRVDERSGANAGASSVDDTQTLPIPDFTELDTAAHEAASPASPIGTPHAEDVFGEGPPTEEIQILALDDAPDNAAEAAPGGAQVAQRLGEALEMWFSWPTDASATEVLRDAIRGVIQAADAQGASQAGKIGGDMEAMVVHIAAGQDTLNDDVRNTLFWARDTLIQQLSGTASAAMEADADTDTDVSAAATDTGTDVVTETGADISIDLDLSHAATPETDGTLSELQGETSPDDRGTDTRLPDAPGVEPRGSESRDTDIVLQQDASAAPANEVQTVASDAPHPRAPRHPIPEEIDEEIIAIFMEEAEEELANIGRLFPVWRSNVQDMESLRDLRRSYHTLKGSGRLVGAVDVGEFAWAFENLLNRIIDRTVEADERVMGLLARAHETLPGLLELYAQGGTPGSEVFNLMEQAEAVSQGREPIPSDEDVADEDAADEARAESTGEAPEKPQSPASLEADTGERVPEIDPVLLDIYRNEASGHLDGVRAFIADCREHHGHCPATESLIRALHTLCGSSRTAGIAPVAELGRALEYFAKLCQEKGLDIGAEGLSVLEETMGYIDTVMALLDVPGTALPAPQALLERVAALHAQAQSMPAQSPRSAESAASPSAQATPVSESSSPDKAVAEAEAAAAREYDEELLDIFLEEGEEILDTSDNLLQQWIASPEQPNLVENMQRELHTLKGGARMAGVTEMGDLSHSLESLLTAVADGHVDTSKRMFDVLQLAQDRLARMLDDVREHTASAPADDLIVAIDELLPGGAHARVPEGRIIAPDGVEELDEPDAGGEDSVADSTTAGQDQAETTASPEEAVGPGRTDTAPASLSDTVSGPVTPPAIADDEWTKVSAAGQRGSDDLGVHKTESADAALPALAEGGTDAGELALPEDGALSPLEGDAQTGDRRKGPRIQQEQIRVRADLLDNLVNFAGEVSIYRSRLEQQVNSFRYNISEFDDTVARLREQLRQFEIATEAQIQYRYEEAGVRSAEDFDPLEFDRFTHMQQLSRGMLESLNDLDSLKGLMGSLTRESETLLVQQSRVNTELQEGLMRSRMVPFSRQASRLRRIVRQVAQEMGKDAELVLTGTDHELDRTVLDRVMAPIEHMLRNAVAHGIEMPAQRHAEGKRASGQINISLTREGSEVVIRVSDDGAGIDLEAIRRKALDRGRVQSDSVLSEDDLLDMILESGFSTAEEVTQIAGRGVGMDVVSSEIKQLGGSLAIDTRKGKGTLFTVRLPLTLSVTRALMVTAGEDTYAIPLLSIEGIERVSHEELQRLYASDKPVYNWLGQEYAFLHLGHTLGVGERSLPGEGRKAPILITRSGDHLAALHVDGLIGSREVVVKPVGPQLSHLRGVSGATIMGDGTVALILDLGVLVRLGTVYETGPLMAQPPVVEEQKLPTVMVVDDSITVRKVTSRLLERHNIQVLTAKDGVEALALLQEQVPDVLLLDIEMPRMDGYELATNVRNDDRLKHIPIIMITSRTGEKHRDRAMLIGVNRYMGKPFQEHDLLDNIQDLLAGNG